jgi:fucose 4-O-acetylase-like acetyltransferase
MRKKKNQLKHYRRIAVGKRDKFWDIVKSIGIISIVIGHCFPLLSKFVYTYHLAIFFLVGGYLFNENKYAKKPFDYIGHKLSSTLPKYFWYFVLFILINNIFIRIGIYPSTYALFSLKDIVAQILAASIFFGPAGVGGALWFVPLLVYSMIFFCFIVGLLKRLNKTKHQLIILGLITILIGVIGIKLAVAKVEIIYHLQSCLLIMPFILIGYFLRKIEIEKVNKYLNPYLSVLCILFILLTLKYTGQAIDISSSNIISPILFYPISIAGLYFVLYLSKILSNLKGNQLLAGIGKYSFDIMALHFLVFKLIDLFYIALFSKNYAILSNFPYSNEKLWPLYIVFGIFGPIAFCKIVDYIKSYITKIVKKFNIINMEENI